MTERPNREVRCPSCGSRERLLRMCVVENCGESHLEPTSFSSTHPKVICCDCWHSLAEAPSESASGTNKHKLLEILRDPYLFEGGSIEKAADRILSVIESAPAPEEANGWIEKCADEMCLLIDAKPELYRDSFIQLISRHAKLPAPEGMGCRHAWHELASHSQPSVKEK